MNSNEHLTNGGKPHVCGQISIHNNTKDKIHLCSKCNMAVDVPSNEHQVPEYERKIRKICTYYSELGEGTAGYDLSEEQFQKLFDLFRSHHAHLKERVMDLKIIENAANFSTAIVNGERGEALMEAHNKALDRVLALLD